MTTCKLCGGYGFVQKDDGHYGIPNAIPCECMVTKALKNQAERAWTNLGLVPPKKKSPLNGKTNENLIITAGMGLLQLNLRTALNHLRSPNLFVKVVGDHTLMSAWLGSMKVQGIDIADPDFQRDLKVYSLEDLAESPYLLVVRLGTKMARNSAMPEVLVETIEMRQHLKKATWLVEAPDKPLEEGHLAWSRSVEESTYGWERVRLLDTNQSSTPTRNSSNGKPTKSLGTHKRVTL
jgi:hypothetical protein